MTSTSHGIVSRVSARIGRMRSGSAERQMHRREQQRAYWAAWESHPSQLAHIHAMYRQEVDSAHH